MSTSEYVPSDARMREQYIWAHAREAEGVAEQSYSIQVCSEAWDAWLAAHDARVRRDATREALDGYAAEEEDSFLSLHVKDAPIAAAQCTHAAITAREYRDTHYPIPEETP